APRSLNWLDIKCRNAICAQFDDLRSQGRDRRSNDSLGMGTDRIAIGIVRWNFVLPAVRYPKSRMKGGDRGQAGPCRRRSVVAMLEGNELILLRRTLGMIIVPNKSDRAVDGIGATQREVNMVQIARRQFGQPGGQPDGR